MLQGFLDQQAALGVLELVQAGQVIGKVQWGRGFFVALVAAQLVQGPPVDPAEGKAVGDRWILAFRCLIEAFLCVSNHSSELLKLKWFPKST